MKKAEEAVTLLSLPTLMLVGSEVKERPLIGVQTLGEKYTRTSDCSAVTLLKVVATPRRVAEVLQTATQLSNKLYIAHHNV